MLPEMGVDTVHIETRMEMLGGWRVGEQDVGGLENIKIET